HVARLYAGLLGGTVRADRGDQRSARGVRVEPEALGDRRRDVLNRNAEPAPGDVAVLPELGNYVLGDVRRNREPDPDRPAGGRIDRRVDADHPAVQVKGWTSRIAAVDRRIDLQKVVVRPFIDIAPERRDDPRGDRAAETERIADRDNPVA